MRMRMGREVSVAASPRRSCLDLYWPGPSLPVLVHADTFGDVRRGLLDDHPQHDRSCEAETVPVGTY